MRNPVPGRRALVLAAALTVLSAGPLLGQARPATASTSVDGYVTGRFQDQVRALPFAMVEAVSGTRRLRSVTDASGRYSLTGLAPGEVTLSVTHAGYEPLSIVVAIPARDTLSVDIEMRATPVALTPVDIRADRRSRSREAEGELGRGQPMSELDMHALEVGPGLGQGGIVDVISALPGNEPGDATDVLFMRGSTTDMKLVLLDGVPVYTPFHVAGLLRSFEPTVLGSAELHVGGAPARYDGGLTHILELSTRSARRDAVHFSGSVDLLSGSGAVEMPLGSRAGLVASARTMHDLASAPLGQEGPYGYQDGLVSLDFEPAAGQVLRATGFWNRESVALDLEPTTDEAEWSNRAGSVAYRVALGGKELEVTAGLSSYGTSLPLQPSAPPQGPVPAALLATAETNRARFVAELSTGSAAAPLRTGLSYERIDAGFAARVLGGQSTAASQGTTSTLGAFIDATRPLAPGLSLRAGLRVDHFTGRTTRLAPRASISWAVAPEALLTVAAGRYHQPTRAPGVDVESTLTEVAQNGLESAELLPIATADHVVLSLDQRLGTSARLGLQGFWKAYQGLPGSAGEGVRNSGVDVRVLSGSDDAAVWLGYGLSWYWSTVDLSGQPTDFSGRHVLSAGVSGGLGGPFRGEARIAYGAGLPYTSVPVGYDATTTTTESAGDDSPMFTSLSATTEELAPGLAESFLRLDAEIYALFRPSWGDRGWRVRPYLRLLNALDRRDALFYQFERWRSDSVRPLAELPVLPLVGVAVSF